MRPILDGYGVMTLGITSCSYVHKSWNTLYISVFMHDLLCLQRTQ